MPIFTSAIVLLLSIWGGKRSGLTMDPHKQMVDVHKCMKGLKASESRVPTAGSLWYAFLIDAWTCSNFSSLGMFCTSSPALEECRHPNLLCPQEQNGTVNRTLHCRPVPASCLPLFCRRMKHQGSLLVHEGFVKNLRLLTRRSNHRHFFHNINGRKQHPQLQQSLYLISPYHPHHKRLCKANQPSRSKLRPQHRPLMTPISTYLLCLCTATTSEGFHYTDT